MKDQKKFDLTERTAIFAENIIAVVRKMKIDYINRKIVEQLVSSAGSIGANYSEATEAESVKDFIHKLCIARKEAKESQHWMRLLVKANPEVKEVFISIWCEANELILILSKSIKTARSKIDLP